ncbi:hypothetical protein TNCT_568701 [Trichonephila clavata]|uniref:Uncharacterized protein n=1 Tax=Trichonephila clavata TaxID=2740835 RepID=A0A8X6LVE6_TRICU|nr:hypothetical protein TNCT_568701 [Trichonephila clavata]
MTEGPWVDRPTYFTTPVWWDESAQPNPSTARQRPCDSGTNGPPTHRLDLTERPWVDRPACFTTQGRSVESAHRILPRLGNGRVSAERTIRQPTA